MTEPHDFARRVLDLHGQSPDSWRSFIILQYESFLLFLEQELELLSQECPEYLGHVKLLRVYLTKLSRARWE